MDTLDFNHFARPQSYGDSSEETGHECDSPAFSRVRSERNSVILCPAGPTGTEYYGTRYTKGEKVKGRVRVVRV